MIFLFLWKTYYFKWATFEELCRKQNPENPLPCYPPPKLSLVKHGRRICSKSIYLLLSLAGDEAVIGYRPRTHSLHIAIPLHTYFKGLLFKFYFRNFTFSTLIHQITHFTKMLLLTKFLISAALNDFQEFSSYETCYRKNTILIKSSGTYIKNSVCVSRCGISSSNILGICELKEKKISTPRNRDEPRMQQRRQQGQCQFIVTSPVYFVTQSTVPNSTNLII